MPMKNVEETHADSEDSEIDAEKAQKATLGEVIERMGVGHAQVRVALLGGAVFFADGAELLLISSVAKAVSDEWHFNPGERSAVVSLVFIGVLFGNLLSGPLGDNCGRRLPIVISFVSIFVFSFLSAGSWNFLSLCIFRTLVGVSFGIGQPTSQTLTSEVTPSGGRIIMSGMAMSTFAVGECYSAVLLMADDPELKNLHWRLLLMLGAIPAAVFALLAYFFLQNSPLYLVCCGRLSEARQEITYMQRANSAEHVSVDFQVQKAEPDEAAAETEPLWKTVVHQVGVIFSRDMWVTTLIVLTSCFTVNLTFYGCLYAFPQIMQDVKMGGTPAADLLVGAVFEFIGYPLCSLAAMFLQRKTCMRIFFLGNATALASFTVGALCGGSWIMQFLLYFGYYVIKFLTAMGFVVIYLYAAEVYPTVARNSGTAISIAGGRIAAILGPPVYEAISAASGGNFVAFFVLMAVLSVVNLVLISFLPYETAGMELKDDLGGAPSAAILAEAKSERGYGSTADK